MRASRWRHSAISLLSVGGAALAVLVWTQIVLSGVVSVQTFFGPDGPAIHPGDVPGAVAPAALSGGNPTTPNPWLQLTNAPPAGFLPGLMMVIATAPCSSMRTTPAPGRSSPQARRVATRNGTWSAVASMPSGYQPEYYVSQVLPTGQLLVDGGEYNGSGTEVWTTLGAIYNPITNTWASVSPPTGWLNTGDAQSEMLPTATWKRVDNRPLHVGAPVSDGSSGSTGMDNALYNTNGTWTKIPGTGKLDPQRRGGMDPAAERQGADRRHRAQLER